MSFEPEGFDTNIFMELQKITDKVCELAIETGEYIRKETENFLTSDIEVKGLNNFVTYVDKKSEEKLIEGLASILPGTGFIAEESPLLKTGKLNWVIDPLDGTTNFIHGIPVFSISIALMEDNEVLSGVIYEINRDECFYTWQGSPSQLNGSIIKVSEAANLGDCLLATGFPYYDFERLDAYMSVFRYFMESTHGIRRLGSAAADLAYVACGRFDGFYEYGLNPWDVAAGCLLVENAGGKLCDFRMGKDYIFGKEIIATNAMVFDEFKLAFEENFR
jgi:myo-inositol-1(or 4)-monophosphatase